MEKGIRKEQLIREDIKILEKSLDEIAILISTIYSLNHNEAINEGGSRKVFAVADMLRDYVMETIEKSNEKVDQLVKETK